MQRIASFVTAFTLVAATGFLLSSCGGDTSQRLILTGSSTIAPLASEIGKRFESQHPGVRIDVQTGGSSRGIADARNGTADIGMASRALKDSESDIFAHEIARDGICVILHAENPVEELTDEQVIAIYTGGINNWSEAGGVDAPITVVNKAEGRATLEVFLGHFKIENPAIEADIIVGDNEQGVKTVTGDPHAIGYVSIGTAEYNRDHGAALKLLPSNGLAASVKTLATGEFPMSRPLNLVTSAPPEGLVKEFIDYCQSEEVHDLVEAQFFVPPAR